MCVCIALLGLPGTKSISLPTGGGCDGHERLAGNLPSRVGYVAHDDDTHDNTHDNDTHDNDTHDVLSRHAATHNRNR